MSLSSDYLHRDKRNGVCTNLPSAKNAATSGFSLAEVVIALGLVAIMLIPLTGLLTLVKKNSYKSDTIFLSSSIATQIISEVHQADRAQLNSWAGSPRQDFYYDYEGLQIASDEEAAFTARLIIEKAPITLGANVENPYLGKVNVHVCSIPGPKGGLVIDEMISSDTNRRPGSVRTYPSVIVDLEK